MAAASNPLARPLVFATQAALSVAAPIQALSVAAIGLPLITLLMLCSAKDRQENRQTHRQVSLPT